LTGYIFLIYPPIMAKTKCWACHRTTRFPRRYSIGRATDIALCPVCDAEFKEHERYLSTDEEAALARKFLEKVS